MPDPDGDKYTDAQEVYNLYNPAGKEPMKLIESALVKEFVNPSFSYRVYQPISWATGAVDQEYRTVLFSTLTGENIEVRAIDKPPSQTFEQWFAEWAPGEKISDLTAFSSVFKENGFRRSDDLVFYFPTADRVYVFTYHTTDSTAVNYRFVIKMMARSFRFSSTLPTVPERTSEGSAASTALSTSTPL